MPSIPTLFKSGKWTDTPVPGPLDGLTQGILEGAYIGDDINGTVLCSYIMTSFAPDKKLDNCKFDGQQLFSGTVLGKKGTLVARESGHISDGMMTVQWTILPETATGELVGITGQTTYSVKMDNDKDKAIPGHVEVHMP